MAKTKTAASKKQTTKKPATKASAKKTASARKPATKGTPISNLKTPKVAVKRPATNPTMPLNIVNDLTLDFDHLRDMIEDYAAHMRALDRRRLNGVGIKKQGFIERAYMLATDNPEFLPHWLPLDKFREDNNHYIALRNLFDLNKQIGELIWNLVMQSSDMVYTDSLEFYSSVREAAKRRVDAAESLNDELRTFFKSRGKRSEDEPTQAEIKHDMNALLRGRKDGKVVVENISPKTTGGKRKLVAETYKDTVSVKETAEADSKE